MKHPKKLYLVDFKNRYIWTLEFLCIAERINFSINATEKVYYYNLEYQKIFKVYKSSDENDDYYVNFDNIFHKKKKDAIKGLLNALLDDLGERRKEVDRIEDSIKEYKNMLKRLTRKRMKK